MLISTIASLKKHHKEYERYFLVVDNAEYQLIEVHDGDNLRVYRTIVKVLD